MMSKLESGVLTQSQCGEIAFKRLIKDIIKEIMDGTIALSLLEYTNNKVDIRYVLTMFEEEIDELTYTVVTKAEDQQDKGVDSEAEGTTKPSPDTGTSISYMLPRGYKRLVKVIIAFSKYRTYNNDPIMDDWSNVSSEEFNDFRMRGYQIYTQAPMPERFNNPNDPSSNTSPYSSSKTSKAEQFKKGIKRDPSLFHTLKNKKHFKSWNRHLLTTVGIQDVKEVLDPQYEPKTPEDAELFQLKQEYMYNIADTILQTDRGIVYVGQHEHDHDA